MEHAIVELRRYTLHPGRGEELITLFEREFVESQEAVGMGVVGTFRELGDPDRFVWFRGFADMASRLAGLTAFYGGPVWREHGVAAGATMIDSDDVLLLEPVEPALGFPEQSAPRPAVGEGRPGPSRVLVVELLLGDGAAAGALAAELTRQVAGLLEVDVVALRSAPHVNDFPALPVRDDSALVWVASFPDAARHQAARRRLEADPPWAAHSAEVRECLLLDLEPTARSALR